MNHHARPSSASDHGQRPAADDESMLLLAGFGAGLLLAAARVHQWWGRSRNEQVATSLEEAERVKRELVAVVSHEFRTPLTSIRGFAQTLEERGERMDGPTVVSCLRAIEGESRRLERLVDNVVVATGEPVGQPEAVAELSRIADTAVADLVDLWGERADRIVVRVEPGLTVRMSATSAVLVVENVLDNAIKFGEPGTEIRLSGRRSGADALIEVTNRGGPIHEEDLDRIFDPFVQGDSSDSRSAPGMGLGLATVQRLVTSHGGHVQARNTLGGVTVAITVPAAAATTSLIPLPAAATN